MAQGKGGRDGDVEQRGSQVKMVLSRGIGDILRLELIEHTKLSHLIDRRHPVTIIHWNGVITVANTGREQQEMGGGRRYVLRSKVKFVDFIKIQPDEEA